MATAENKCVRDIESSISTHEFILPLERKPRSGWRVNKRTVMEFHCISCVSYLRSTARMSNFRQIVTLATGAAQEASLEKYIYNAKDVLSCFPTVFLCVFNSRAFFALAGQTRL